MLEEILQSCETKMDKIIEALRGSLKTIRTGRASASVLDGVLVDAYGQMTPLNQVGGVSVPEADQIVVSPWDKSLIKDIEKAINAADLGLNPSNDGNVIRINVPQLTSERRAELVKKVKKIGEEYKVQIRNARRDANDEVKKVKGDGISEDLKKEFNDKIQKSTDVKTKELDSILKLKEEQILEF